MSQRNGEKARANVARKNRNKQRVKDRANLIEFRKGGAVPKPPKAPKKPKAPKAVEPEVVAPKAKEKKAKEPKAQA